MTNVMLDALIIYNIFLREMPGLHNWMQAMASALNMGFNAIYMSPFNRVGSSRSSYSIMDLMDYDPRCFTHGAEPIDELREFLQVCKERCVLPIMDLVINHTAFDSPLVRRYPQWFKYDNAGRIVHPGAGDTVWGDIVTLNYESFDMTLWNYMRDVIAFYCRLGFRGFRCDCANQIYPGFWQWVISSIKAEYPDTVFIAESFCDRNQRVMLGKVGFDYIFNSAKWWQYDGNWLVEDALATAPFCDSIAMPANHDTERGIVDAGRDVEVLKQRIRFTAFISKGFELTAGDEYAVDKRIDVVDSGPENYFTTGIDVRDFIAETITLKKSCASLCEEGDTDLIHVDKQAAVLLRRWRGEAVMLVINKTHRTIRVPFGVVRCKSLPSASVLSELVDDGFILAPLEVRVVPINSMCATA